jgi:hypothetical protein
MEELCSVRTQFKLRINKEKLHKELVKDRAAMPTRWSSALRKALWSSKTLESSLTKPLMDRVLPCLSMPSNRLLSWCLNADFRSIPTISTSPKLWMFLHNYSLRSRVMDRGSLAKPFRLASRMSATLGQILISPSRTRRLLASRGRGLWTRARNYCTLPRAQYMLIFQKARRDRVTSSLLAKEISKIILWRTVYCMVKLIMVVNTIHLKLRLNPRQVAPKPWEWTTTLQLISSVRAPLPALWM